MRQGKNAPAGAKSYIVNGKMTEGFAFVAYPQLRQTWWYGQPQRFLLFDRDESFTVQVDPRFSRLRASRFPNRNTTKS